MSSITIKDLGLSYDLFGIRHEFLRVIRGDHILKVLEELNSAVGILQFVNKKTIRGTASIAYQLTRQLMDLLTGQERLGMLSIAVAQQMDVQPTTSLPSGRNMKTTNIYANIYAHSGYNLGIMVELRSCG